MPNPIGFYKALPTEYVLLYVGGRIRREGQGLAFYYLRYNTQIVAVPTSSIDVNFVFNEVTGNFQAVTIQGQFTYRIQQPREAAALLNFTVDPATRVYLSNDPDRLAQRIANIIQMETRTSLHGRSLEETLAASQEIAAEVAARVGEGRLLEPLGVELMSVYFLAVSPTAEVGKALEAEYRETLLRRADEAIYARRAAAVEEERKIKENELNTDITLEQQRRQLIELQGANTLQEAEHKGRALETEAEYRARATERQLAAFGTMDSRRILAHAIRALGENAGRIRNLTLTTEVLGSLLDATTNESADGGKNS
jgi:hypothetical protein